MIHNPKSYDDDSDYDEWAGFEETEEEREEKRQTRADLEYEYLKDRELFKED